MAADRPEGTETKVGEGEGKARLTTENEQVDEDVAFESVTIKNMIEGAYVPTGKTNEREEKMRWKRDGTETSWTKRRRRIPPPGEVG